MVTLRETIADSRVEAEHLERHGKFYIAQLLRNMADGAERALDGASDDRVRDVLSAVAHQQEHQHTVMTTEEIVRVALNTDRDDDPLPPHAVFVSWKSRRSLLGSKAWRLRSEITTSQTSTIYWEGQGVPADIQIGDFLNGVPWMPEKVHAAQS